MRKVPLCAGIVIVSLCAVAFNDFNKLSNSMDSAFFKLTTYIHNKGSDNETAFPTTVLKEFHTPQLPVPKGFQVETVNNNSELIQAISRAHKYGGKTAIFLEDGEYEVNRSIRITADDIMFLSVSSNPYKAVIKGPGMMRTKGVQNIFEVRASGFVLDGITLKDAPNHLIQIAAENNASRPIIRNCILQDSFEQLLKVSYDQFSRAQNISSNGIIEQCIFQYTQGHAPYYYTGGIDALGAKDWLVQNNIFKDIASPGKHIAQHAVHFWVNASDNVVKNNIFIDNDRAIGFGMKQTKRNLNSLDYFSKGGEISRNLIFHAKNGDPFADVGIILEASPNTVVDGNYIFMLHGYPRAIEYRFAETKNAVIKNNYTNKPIRSRDGGSADLANNSDSLKATEFYSEFEMALTAQNILHLAEPINGETLND